MLYEKKQGSQVFLTECEIQGAHHMMYMTKPRFSSHL